MQTHQIFVWPKEKALHMVWKVKWAIFELQGYVVKGKEQ